jgi:hypothetical protein
MVHPLFAFVLGADAHAVEFVDAALPREVFLDVMELGLAASPVADVGEVWALLAVALAKRLAAVDTLGHSGSPTRPA